MSRLRQLLSDKARSRLEYGRAGALTEGREDEKRFTVYNLSTEQTDPASFDGPFNLESLEHRAQANTDSICRDKSATRGPSLSLTKTLSGMRPVTGSGQGAVDSNYQQLKSKIHDRLIENLDINALIEMESGDSADLEDAIETTIHMLMAEERLLLSEEGRNSLARDVLYETLGLGPLEPLLQDPQVCDILVNGAHSVWVDLDGRLTETDVKFKDESHLLHVINRVVARVGRRIDESSPIVDARLPDGSRVNAIIPPLALDGACLSIRRFRTVPFKFDDLVKKGTLSQEMAIFLELAVSARLNILVSGGTSAGKTTLLNVLSGHISDRERIVTIEDTAELMLRLGLALFVD
ncbi:MAG: Flp pilus assembly complex ATPase component TadA, partial [Cyanobacteria bacterium]|nr:Flp pilus assembly complex ATPase component TadA [Cyanobacteriota bacterium]